MKILKNKSYYWSKIEKSRKQIEKNNDVKSLYGSFSFIYKSKEGCFNWKKNIINTILFFNQNEIGIFLIIYRK